jgi:hypothetical protein
MHPVKQATAPVGAAAPRRFGRLTTGAIRRADRTGGLYRTDGTNPQLIREAFVPVGVADRRTVAAGLRGGWFGTAPLPTVVVARRNTLHIPPFPMMAMDIPFDPYRMLNR